MLGSEGDSVNGKTGTVKTITPQKFAVDLDISCFTAYEGNGIAKQVKVPKTLNFKPCAITDEALDDNLLVSDFEKMENKRILHFIYRAILETQS